MESSRVDMPPTPCSPLSSFYLNSKVCHTHTFLVCFPYDRYAKHPLRLVLTALQSAVASLLSPGWCLITLADAGVSFLDVIEAYDRVMMQRDHDVTLGAPDVDEFNQISAKLEFLEHWLSVVSSAADPRGRRTGVHMELRNVRFARQMEAIRAQIGRTSVPTIQSRYFQLEESAQALL